MSSSAFLGDPSTFTWEDELPHVYERSGCSAARLIVSAYANATTISGRIFFGDLVDTLGRIIERRLRENSVKRVVTVSDLSAPGGGRGANRRSFF